MKCSMTRKEKCDL